MQDDRARSGAATVCNIGDAQLHQIARSKLEVDSQVEKREITRLSVELKAYANRPDALSLRGVFCR